MEFASPEAAADAVEAKQKGHLRHRYIECVLLPRWPCEEHNRTALLQDCLAQSSQGSLGFAESAIFCLASSTCG